jgi:hypothetical protein
MQFIAQLFMAVFIAGILLAVLSGTIIPFVTTCLTLVAVVVGLLYTLGLVASWFGK